MLEEQQRDGTDVENSQPAVFRKEKRVRTDLEDQLCIVRRERGESLPIGPDLIPQLDTAAARIREKGAVELSVEPPQARDRLIQVPPPDQEGRGKLGKGEVRLHKTPQDRVLQESRAGRHGHPSRPER